MTIYDIAKIAGVSASTVSRVANKKPGIKEETRRYIEGLLEKYDYVPNETARGLVTRTSKIVGILLVDIRYLHHVKIVYNIERELRKRGYCGIIYNTGQSEEEKVEGIRFLEQRRVDGAILIGSTFQSDAVKDAISSNLPKTPIVITNGYLDLPNVYGVLVDEREGVEKCVELMIRKGHEDLAFVLPNHTPSNLLKMKGFTGGMLQHGSKMEDILIYESPTSLEDGYAVTKKILDEHPGIQGIIYGEDLAAVGGIHALADAGIKIPGQVAVIGVDNTIYGEIVHPKLTSLDNMMLDMSLEAAKILLDTLQGIASKHKSMLFSEIIERDST